MGAALQLASVPLLTSGVLKELGSIDLGLCWGKSILFGVPFVGFWGGMIAIDLTSAPMWTVLTLLLAGGLTYAAAVKSPLKQDSWLYLNAPKVAISLGLGKLVLGLVAQVASGLITAEGITL